MLTPVSFVSPLSSAKKGCSSDPLFHEHRDQAVLIRSVSKLAVLI